VTPELSTIVRVVRLLDALAIPYMLTGSLASSHYGRPRASHDADIVIDPTPLALDRLASELALGGFYLDAGRARDALFHRRQFNVIDGESAFKVDLIVRKDRPFSREEFGRRLVKEVLEGVTAAIATPEDTILSKLEWAKRGGGSEKQLLDVAGILDVTPGLDLAFIQRWARELGVLDLWQSLGDDRRS
jgi:hypothetical protein